MRRRVIQNRKLSKRGLILCEGHTEENYFKGLMRDYRYRDRFSSVSVDIYQPKNYSPLGLVQEAKSKIAASKRERNPFDFLWVVFDRDSHPKLPHAFSEAARSKPKINIAFSAICFEYFVLLHFVKTTTTYRTCSELIAELNVHYPKYKKASNLYKHLLPYMETGIENSRWAMQTNNNNDYNLTVYERAVYTNVHELIDYLYNL